MPEKSIPPIESVTPDTVNMARLHELVKKAEALVASISGLVESAKTSATATAESQSISGNILVECQTKLTEITAVGTQATATRTQIADEQAVIATKSAHIQQAQEHADSVRASLDRTLTEATQQATEAEGLKSRAQSATDTATTLLTEIRTTKGSVETEATTVTDFRKSAEESATLAKGLADKSATIETRIAQYETRLAELDTECADRLEKVENILRGATSAGLAHAFDQRRQTFLKPHGLWQWVFIGSLVLLVILALNGLWTVYHFDTAPQWDELVRMWLSRIPLVGALVWLAMHASREAALAKRMEEDYGYKLAIATCFEGFRKEMTAIDVSMNSDSALAKLCADTLTTMATPPGRIYDKHSLAATPIDELKDLTKAATEAAKSAINATTPLVEAAAKIGKLGP
jgi:small-conductance mechanosensitive channel